MSAPGVVVAGGGLAAQRFCEALRSGGYEKRIRVLCDEQTAPYDRPPLSKSFLLGNANEADLAFRTSRWYDEQQVELLLGERACSLDPHTRTVQLQSGGQLSYEQLLIATGSEPRRLPIAEGFDNVHYLRTAADARGLRRQLTPGSKLAIVGAGFIGLEVAASARKIGVEVTIIEALAAPLERIVGAQLGHWFAEMHRQEGAELVLGATIASFEGNDTARALVLADGRRIECDAVVVGIGIVPATAWLADSGLPTGGVPVDGRGRTEIDGIYAAGDAAQLFDPHLGMHVRTEHWEAAARQGTAAAHAMLGRACKRGGPSSFWSDQYGVRIQHIGRTDGADRVEIEGDPSARNFAATYYRQSIPLAALLVGRPQSLPDVRRQLALARSQPSASSQPDTQGEDTHADNADPLLTAG